MNKKRSKLKSGEGKTGPAMEGTVPVIETPGPSELSQVIAESKAALAEPPKNKGGRPKGWRKPKEPEVSPAPILPVEPQPGPMTPILGEAHKAFYDGLAVYCQRPQWRMEEEKALALGGQLDVVLQYWLPDLEKDPKKLALYTYLFTTAMIGVAILREPKMLGKVPAPKPKMAPKPAPTPEPRAEEMPDRASDEPPPVQAGQLERAPFMAQTSDPFTYFPVN